MTKVVIDMTMSLDGFVAGPGDGKQFPLGKHGGMAIFDWYTSGDEEIQTPLFKPKPGANRKQVERMFSESGALICRTASGSRSYRSTTDISQPTSVIG
jgi:hypothetical protein